ncbi:hypothetical protein AVEN_151890-1 [Araneus ventricosus]|uniref:Uncharacterized protein n=1 Tax=Araneus ventricosus TaxID=182803 RepID=A0A4Y2EIM7_ARAVE|nr:hypothetical protein AVEN_151890-1 [Araneus ventricosus]
MHRDRKLTFKDHKREISHDFPDNEVARCSVTWALHGISSALKYAVHPSDVRGSHDAPFQNAPTTPNKLEDKQRCRNGKLIMTSLKSAKL